MGAAGSQTALEQTTTALDLGMTTSSDFEQGLECQKVAQTAFGALHQLKGTVISRRLVSGPAVQHFRRNAPRVLCL